MTTATFGIITRTFGERDIALDVFRGLMIIGMLIVNHPPPTDQLFLPFVHVDWNGWRLADTIFPGFLFAVGFSIAIVHGGAGAPTLSSATVMPRILRRFVVLMAANYLLMNFPYYTAQFSIRGTLANIAWCYLGISFLALRLRSRELWSLLSALLAAQWATYYFAAAPGFSPGDISPAGNAARHIDDLLAHSAGSSLPAPADWTPTALPLLGMTCTTLIGYLLALHRNHIGRLMLIGFVLVLLGQFLDYGLAINKTLWTTSYVLLMAGLSCLGYCVLRWMPGRIAGSKLIQPIRSAGMNALAVYVLAQSLQRLITYVKVADANGTTTNLRSFTYEQLFQAWMPGKPGTAIWLACFVVVCLGAAALLRRLDLRISA